MKSFFCAFAAMAFATSLEASFHFMQVEQVIGSLNGDNTAQAVQLRMRSAGQNLVSQSRVRVWDAAGANPILLLDITTNVPTGAAGARVLLCTSAFTTAMQAISPGFTPDFTMASAIPASYFAAGRLTFEDDSGNVYWSLAWGGAGYTGSHTGFSTNDANGDFGPAFGQGLPTTGHQGILFQGAASAGSTTNAADYALSADPATVTKNNGTSFLTAGVPEIVVEQPAGTNLVSGVASVSFGNAAVSTETTRAFTVKNTGSAALTGLGITIGGVDEADFTVTANPTAPLGPGGSTTFTVSFAPDTTGTKTAELQIASNDANESPFIIGLAGMGTAPIGSLSLGSAFFLVEETAGTLTIPVVRTGGSFGDVSVSVSTTNGTATTGSDFTLVTATETFLDGDTSEDIVISIANPPATSEANETFTVILSAPTGGATLGAVTTATVRIVDSVDTIAPGAPLIGSPAANATVNVLTGGTLTITGTATDNKGIGAVRVALNGGAPADASISDMGKATTDWSLIVTPGTGSNTISVQSFDTLNNPSAATVRTFKVARSLAVAVNDTALGTLTAGFAPSSFREVGKIYTVTASPKPPAAVFGGGMFHKWEITWAANTPTPPAVPATEAESAARIGVPLTSLEKTSLTFIFREGLELTAEFDESPFALMAGSYQGLIRPSATLPDRAPAGGGVEDGTTRTNASEGYFKATVQNTGAFSGTLTVDGLSLNVSGTFDHHGDARFGTTRAKSVIVARPGKPSLVVALKINWEENETDVEVIRDKITGTITALDFQQSVTAGVSTLEADRAYYNGTTLIPSNYLSAGNANGLFTAILPAKPVIEQTGGFATQDYPQGCGFASITVTKTGSINLAGTLADGSSISASSALSQGNRFPLFVQLYNKQGFLSGFVQLDSLQPESDMAGADLQWLRPFLGTSHFYPFGWSQAIKVDLRAARYTAVAGQSVLRAPNGVPLAVPDVDGNVALSFHDGQLSESIEKAANLTTADVVTKAPSNDPTFTITVTRTTGAVSGTFAHTDDTVPSYKAIIYQKGAAAGGYGFFLTKQPVPIDYTGESGGVKLIGQP